jgi:hypothetical protein
MKLTKVILPEIADEIEASVDIDLEAAIEEQTRIVARLSESADSGVRGDELFKLAKLHFRNKAFSLAMNFAVQAVGLRRLFYGRDAKEFLEAVALAQLITKEVQRTNPPRKRRKVSKDK